MFSGEETVSGQMLCCSGQLLGLEEWKEHTPLVLYIIVIRISI